MLNTEGPQLDRRCASLVSSAWCARGAGVYYDLAAKGDMFGMMIGGTSVSATWFRVCSRGPVWGLDEYDECSSGNESLMPKLPSLV